MNTLSVVVTFIGEIAVLLGVIIPVIAWIRKLSDGMRCQLRMKCCVSTITTEKNKQSVNMNMKTLFFSTKHTRLLKVIHLLIKFTKKYKAGELYRKGDEIMNNIEFANKAKNIAENYKTAYVWGAFGLVANAANMQRMINQYSKNNQYLAKARQIYGNGFFFDCVGLIKGILWGFCGNKNATYGGAKYTANGVPDISADQMINCCKEVSTDFKNIEVGEVVWLSGHIGIYIGGGKVVEATPAWSGGVQVSDISTSGKRTKNGSGTAYWKRHGKLPYIIYESEGNKMLETGNEIIRELMNGEHKIEINDIQRAVNALDKAKNNPEFMSLYWILYKLVNGNG